MFGWQAPISPIICPFATVYFALGYLTVKYKALYCIVPTDEGGGEFWPVLFAKIRVRCIIDPILPPCNPGPTYLTPTHTPHHHHHTHFPGLHDQFVLTPSNK